jgi:hypothetical protein
LRRIKGIAAPAGLGGHRCRTRGAALEFGPRLRLGDRIAAPLRCHARGRSRGALAETEIDILLEFAQLLFEPAGLELHLLHLPVELANLTLKPPHPDEEA